jgi:hypothetical protein
MMPRWIVIAITITLLGLSADAFVVPTSTIISTTRSTMHTMASRKSSVETSAFWRHWIPETDLLGMHDDDTNKESSSNNKNNDEILENAKMAFMASFVAAAVLMLAPTASVAVSGGGLDFAGIDISGKDFSNNDYKGKDFTQVLAKGTNFANSNLQGCRFYRAYLVRD